MLEDYSDQAFLALADVAHLRLEALQLFEQGLISEDVSDLMRFIERQLAQDPPQLLLLRELADDLDERLALLRAHHRDTREQVVRLLSDGYALDITPLTPADSLEQYHSLSLGDVMDRVLAGSAEARANAALLRRLIDASLRKAAELHRSIELTQQVSRLLGDWLEGINAMTARRYGHYFVDRKQHIDLWQ